MEKTFSVKTNEVGERIDKWLCKRLPTHSRKQIKALLDGGKILVNRRRVLIAGWELENGDSVEVRFPHSFGKSESSKIQAPTERDERRRQPERRDHRAKPASGIAASIDRHLQRRKRRKTSTTEERKDEASRPRDKRIKIYHEDRDLIVVEKPAGILTVAREKDRDGDSLIGMVKAYMKRKHKGSKSSFVYPLHRLDVETSGVVVFALSNVGKNLEGQFRNHTIQREYQAVVVGKIPKESGIINRALKKGKFRGGRKAKTSSKESGKPAITEYRVIERYEDATLVNIWVRTGRTHQIRVHFASEGFPLIGDKLYREDLSVGKKFHRHALHARSLGFKHPKGGKKMFFKSPIPEDLKMLIDGFRDPN